MSGHQFDSEHVRRDFRDINAGGGQSRHLQPQADYLKNWKLVKRARFNAAKRFERKQSASTLAFALAGIIGFLVPFYTLLFKDALSEHTKNVFDFTAYVTGALSLLVGLIEQAKDYPTKSKKFDTCGRKVNVVLRRLTILPSNYTHQQLESLIKDYELALDECHENHDDIDYEIAKAQEQVALSHKDESEKQEAQKHLYGLKRLERIQIYWLYIAVWVTPILIGAILWGTLYAESAPPSAPQNRLFQFSPS